jgi:hypothetical protein
MYATDNDKLSKQNCDEIFGVVDVEKLAEKEVFQEYYDWGGEVFSEDYLISKRLHFIEGFNKAVELNKDKVFTLEQMSVAYNTNRSGTLFEQLINSFGGQPTEIEVMIVMDILNEYEQPKLDSEGCLILKKI